jgi:hypothetical protein
VIKKGNDKMKLTGSDQSTRKLSCLPSKTGVTTNRHVTVKKTEPTTRARTAFFFRLPPAMLELVFTAESFKDKVNEKVLIRQSATYHIF